MLKIMTIVGTRPEIIKLSRIIAELDLYSKHVLVHTGQNYDYELNEIFFEQMGIRKPNHFLNAVGATTAETIGNVIINSDRIMESEKPDAILLYGDTNSCLSIISAKRRKIPVFHMEAGNRCFDQRVPEEINRKIVDHLSDINMPITEHARRNLLDEGIKPETIIKTGSCMPEILSHYSASINKSDVVERLELVNGEYFVVSLHREENVDSPENFLNFINSLNEISNAFKKRIIFSTHPRTMKKIEQLPTGTFDPLVTFMKPLGFFDYVKLQKNAFCVISDSGTITEEASIMNIPAITIRNSHERPEGMDVGTLIMSGLEASSVINAIDIVTMQHKSKSMMVPDDYKVPNVSAKVLRTIHSYVGYINRTVWHK